MLAIPTTSDTRTDAIAAIRSVTSAGLDPAAQAPPEQSHADFQKRPHEDHVDEPPRQPVWHAVLQVVRNQRPRRYRLIARRRDPGPEHRQAADLDGYPRRCRPRVAREVLGFDARRLPAGRDADGTERQNLVVDVADVLDAPAAYRNPNERVELGKAARVACERKGMLGRHADQEPIAPMHAPHAGRIRPCRRLGRLEAGNIGRGDAVSIVLLLLGMLAGCGGPSKPDRIVAPDVVGVVDSVVRSDPSQLTVTLVDRQTVTIDTEDASEVFGSGPGEGRLLLYGSTDNRVWYATPSLRETSPTPGCYSIFADAAFDEPDAVVFVFTEFRDMGIRIRKAKGFMTPSGAVGSYGRYAQGEVGIDYGSFCLNGDGLVFGMP